MYVSMCLECTKLMTVNICGTLVEGVLQCLINITGSFK